VIAHDGDKQRRRRSASVRLQAIECQYVRMIIVGSRAIDRAAGMFVVRVEVAMDGRRTAAAAAVYVLDRQQTCS
jgi:hypothetical protein